VLGRTPFGAEVELRRAGFGDEIAWTERVSGATRGTVVFQRPAPDTTAPLDVELELTVAVPAWVEVPEVTGLDVDEAARLVDAAGRAVMAALDRDGPPGLSVGTVTPLDDVAEVGRVVAQRPTAGERVPLHGVVELDVSVGESIPVPDLAGLDQPAALAVLGGAGLRLGRVTTRAGEEAPGTVVGQEPAPGRVLPAGLRVDIVVAAASQVRVPHLGGFDSPAAQEALAARSLDLGPIELVVGEGEPGRIVGQDPEPDSLVAVGTEVSIVVVDGVPGLVGASRDDAVRRLEDAGLTAVEGEVESTGPAGIVVSQDPVKGAAVPADRRVRIGVAVPARVEVPDLVGLLPQAAVDALARQGLAGRVQASEPGPNDPPTIAEGAVRRQQPAAGERAPRGSTVSLWLRAAQNVTVPDVVGRTPAEATKALTAAQLTPEIGAPLPSSSVPAGNIAATDPPAGTSVPKFRRVLLRPAAAMIRVPSVLGLSEGRAREVLRSVGLSDVAIEDLFAPHDPGGALVRAVVDQSPAEGAVVSPETRVRLTLGVQLRDVSGSDQRLAMRVLAQDGIEVVGTVAETSRSFAEGLVTRTDPAAGSVITPGTQVWLHVSSGSIFVDPGRLVVEPEWIIPIRREPDPEPFTRIDVGRLDLGRIVRPDS
ncbi:MAG: PASTA domain-containing protein, partial [Acidimicrobiia bacterium]